MMIWECGYGFMLLLKLRLVISVVCYNDALHKWVSWDSNPLPQRVYHQRTLWGWCCDLKSSSKQFLLLLLSFCHCHSSCPPSFLLILSKCCVCVCVYVCLRSCVCVCTHIYVCVRVSMSLDTMNHACVCVCGGGGGGGKREKRESDGRAWHISTSSSRYSVELCYFFFQKAVALDPSDVVSLHSLGYWWVLWIYNCGIEHSFYFTMGPQNAKPVVICSPEPPFQHPHSLSCFNVWK